MEDVGRTNEALEIKLEEDIPIANSEFQKKNPEKQALEVNEEDSSVISALDDSETSVSEESCPAIGIHLEKFWGLVTDYLSENWKSFKIFVYIVLAALYNTYFIACVYYAHINNVVIDWCDGVGLLILLTSVTYAGLFYYQIVKRFWGKTIYRRAMLPMRTVFRRVWAFRYLIKEKLYSLAEQYK